MTRGRCRIGFFATMLLIGAIAVTAVGVDTSGGGAQNAQASTATIPESIINRYLSTRPPLGPVTVVNISGEPTQRQLLAATLQGIVNRSKARIYLVGARQASQDQYWLDQYTSEGLINVVAHDTLDQALAAFSSELSGYVLASYDEPWTLNTATTIAAAKGAVVATADQVAGLQTLGLTQVDNEVGRWPDAATAYTSVAAAYRSQLAYKGMAIEGPTANQPRDFFVQQGIMTVYTRPGDSDYDAVYGLLNAYPTDHPVYGYIADTDIQEVQAIARLSQAGRFLVPTDTTDNLSFHIAVAANAARTQLTPDTRPVAKCTSSTVNVVVSMTDGDNLVMPEAYFAMPNAWNSPQRGTLPLGWGLTPATAVLMPAIWDSYASSAPDNDEIVGLMGLGYSIPSLYPDATGFLEDSARINAALGVQTDWSLDLLLGTPTAAGWGPLGAASQATGWTPDGYLLNYDNYNAPPIMQPLPGLNVLTSQSTSYASGPTQLAAQIQTLLATPASQRPLVTFLAASTWSNTYDGLVSALTPLEQQGVRLLTPRQAFACLKAEEPTTTTSSTSSTTAVPEPSTSTSTSTSVTPTDPPSTMPPVSSTSAPPTTPTSSVEASATTSPSPSSTALPAPGASTRQQMLEAATPISAMPVYTG